MSKLQDRASAIAPALIEGGFPYLDQERCSALAAWAVMVAMNLEYIDPETVVIPQSERTSLMRDGMPSGSWYVGIGRYVGTRFDCSFYHRPHLFLPKSEGSYAVPKPYHALCSVFGLGKVLFHAFSVPSPEYLSRLIHDVEGYAAALGLRTIWPHVGSSLDAALYPFDDGRVAQIIEFFGGPPIGGGPELLSAIHAP